MKGLSRLPVILLTCAAVAGLWSASYGQLIMGQYEEEAPLGSWNAPGPLTAASLGMGGVGMALVFDVSCLISNPALLARLPRFTATLGASRMSASLFRFGMVNTGVLVTSENPVAAFNNLDFAGFSIRSGAWTAGFSYHLAERYDRPTVDYLYESRGRPVYALNSRQSGHLRIGTFGLARRLGPSVGAGLALHIARGTWETAFEEHWIYNNVRITDDRTRRLDGMDVSAGLTWDIVPALTAALVFRSPSTLNSRSRSLLAYLAPLGGTDIRIASEAHDESRRPWLAGAGVAFTPSLDLRFAADVSVTGWAAYRLQSFSEFPERAFRNTVTVRAGAEYRIRQRLFGRSVAIPLRIGGAVDPQPMTNPLSAYRHLTLGSGFETGRIRAAFAFSTGRENGSGHALSAARGALSMSYEWGGER